MKICEQLHQHEGCEYSGDTAEIQRRIAENSGDVKGSRVRALSSNSSPSASALPWPWPDERERASPTTMLQQAATARRSEAACRECSRWWSKRPPEASVHSQLLSDGLTKHARGAAGQRRPPSSSKHGSTSTWARQSRLSHAAPTNEMWVWPEENAAQPKAVARHAYTGGDVCGNREAGEAEAEAVDVAPTTKSRLVSSARCSRLMRQQ